MYKTILQFSFCLLALFIQLSFTKKKNIERIQIQYSQPIDGYQVSIDFIPKDVRNENTIIGRGRIYFTHLKSKHRFVVKNSMMGFPTGLLPIQLAKNKKWIVRVKKRVIKLKYKANYTTFNKYKLGNFGTTEVPFFFQDVNLDGTSELILPKLNSGQRGVAIFKSYELKNGKLINNKDSFTKKKPYNQLDEMTKFYPEKRQLIQHFYGGYKESYDVAYYL